jgi:hypothetical protein
VTSARIPAEFLGLAREFRRQVLHDDAVFNERLPRIMDRLRDASRTLKTPKSLARMAASPHFSH